ncbi:hypothetical protein [Psychrobacter sp. FDAARGOS_221]|uniref:hypothetical protein n=1 Tax=Psychrobacter sp. FDAARGOS_221 TaxID=1975705 RepID=UPI000BB53406|nr:hypothetical protein [Psychrobacter sp. FDAARGOS_221]PNK59460.1 hypothetical protein A6J60_000195 [Psychrobacter sp. FDAARGOS_221]PNK59924.1 hypothetical protein A6J60_002865 [Psychrobacter sp. FDAARGOS_221]PNK61471.1 hypothetical protein A6J60_011750 [Psychrobacter sp. FDAARGOS_221]
MSNKVLVSVMAAGCLSRFRNGMQFTKTPRDIEVTQSELAALEADSYLKVKVLSDDADIKNASGSLGVDEDIAADSGADTAQSDDAGANATESDDDSEASVERLAVITESMRGLNLDMTADKPTVKELKDAGLDVSAKERDHAWDVLVAEYTESIPE